MLTGRRPGTNVSPEIPDQLAVVLKIQHGQGLHGPQDQDLIAPQICPQHDLAHSSPDGRPWVGAALTQHHLDPAAHDPSMIVQAADSLPSLDRVIRGKTGKLEQVGDRTLAFVHGVPQGSHVNHRIGKPPRKLPRILGGIDGMGQDPLQAIDRQGEGGDVVVVEDTRRDERTACLAAAIGEKWYFRCQVTRKLIEGPAELDQPAFDPLQAALVLAADLLGDDAVAASRADIVKVVLHERLARDPWRCSRQSDAQVFHVEPRPQPE